MNTLNISLSALNSFSKVQDVVSNNVANINTEGYSAKRARLEELPNNQGVKVEEVREENTRSQEPERLNQERELENRTNPPQNNVELAREFTEMIQNQNAYNANAQVVRTENQMVGELINKLV